MKGIVIHKTMPVKSPVEAGISLPVRNTREDAFGLGIFFVSADLIASAFETTEDALSAAIVIIVV